MVQIIAGNFIGTILAVVAIVYADKLWDECKYAKRMRAQKQQRGNSK